MLTTELAVWSTVFENNIFSDGEPNNERQMLGLLGAMFDGMVTSFQYRSLRVRRVSDSIVVENDESGPLGGLLYIPSANLIDAHDWLAAKADYYGET